MKSIWSGFCVAFSMYSAIPVPQVSWEKKTMRWALSFLPLIGVIIGGAEFLWLWFCQKFGAASLFYSVVAALLPFVISGGIHLDGLTDTCDALCSFGEREKKLEILKDPHVGAFGPMWLMAFLLTETALFAQIYEAPTLFPVAICGFVMARALGGRKIVTVSCAKDSGLAYLFAEGSDKQVVAWTMLLESVLCTIGLLFVCVHVGSPLGWAVGFLVLLVLWSMIHKRLCMNIFGGITGDLTGFFISTAELLALAVAAFGGLMA